MKMRKEERNIQSIRLRISRISKIDRIEKGPLFYSFAPGILTEFSTYILLLI